MTVPACGARISDADLTDSTAPMVSPAPNLVPTVGSSMNTTSPRALAAYTDIPIVPVQREDECPGNGGGAFGEKECRGRIQ